jgi:hypothetical protein
MGQSGGSYLKYLDYYDFVGLSEIDFMCLVYQCCSLLDGHVARKSMMIAYGRSDCIL